MFCMRNEANKFGNLVELFSKLKVQVSQKLNKGGFPQKKFKVWNVNLDFALNAFQIFKLICLENPDIPPLVFTSSEKYDPF